jgi:hypothetical protein
MSTNNELIVVIDSARARGVNVKAIRRQKYAPNDFYMTLSDGKQVGPIKVAGEIDELNRKFGEAQSYMTAMKAAPGKPRSAAA